MGTMMIIFRCRSFYFVFMFCLIFIYTLALDAETYDPLTVYLTWKHDPDKTVVVHWITPVNRKDDVVEYQRDGEKEWKSVKGFNVPMPEKYPYLIHSVEIKDLLPNTSYRFRTGSDAAIYKFRTMPSKQIVPIRFIVGGDIYHDGLDILEKMNRQAARLDPMFAICGGDLAYNDEKPGAFPKLMPRWMDWLIAWKKQMVTSTGHLIPIVPVIGNHEVKVKYGGTPADALFYYSLFDLSGDQGYYALDFGDYMSLILLDSGHTHPVQGLQTQWLYQTLQGRKQISNKFVAYHVAAFPSVRKYNNDINGKIRKYWVPLFEQFGIRYVFEHHDHAYKRTWPIRAEKVDLQNGVVYLGDGGWAVEQPRKPKDPAKTWYLAKTASSRNVIFVNMHDHLIQFMAINDEGQIIDELVGREQTQARN